MAERYHRNELLFGRLGQQRLIRSHVMIIGAGGLGSHVVQQLAFLGVGQLTILDGGYLKESGRNRYITSREIDRVGREKKVDLAVRLVKEINSDIEVEGIHGEFPIDASAAFLNRADLVIGCVDNDHARVSIAEYALSANTIYIDLATDTDDDDPRRFGGHIFTSIPAMGCLICQGIVDLVSLNGADEDGRERLYGIHADALHATGPSVVSLNGVVASFGVTEAMCFITELRDPIRCIKYYGKMAKVVTSPVRTELAGDCYFCNQLGCQ